MTSSMSNAPRPRPANARKKMQPAARRLIQASSASTPAGAAAMTSERNVRTVARNAAAEAPMRSVGSDGSPAERDAFMSQILSRIASPADLQPLSDQELGQLTHEMRDELIRVLSIRPAHFAS